jgi:hypothetical protein
VSIALTGEPLLQSLAHGDSLLAAIGSWMAQHAADLEHLVDSAAAQERHRSRASSSAMRRFTLTRYSAAAPWLVSLGVKNVVQAISAGRPDRWSKVP